MESEINASKMAEVGKGGTFESGSDTTRVGRWMSQDEYDKMDKKGGADGWELLMDQGICLIDYMIKKDYLELQRCQRLQI